MNYYIFFLFLFPVISYGQCDVDRSIFTDVPPCESMPLAAAALSFDHGCDESTVFDNLSDDVVTDWTVENGTFSEN